MGKHAIIVIKNSQDEYLQYFDEKWNSYLFMNCKMQNKDDKDEIIRKINESLLINSKCIKCEFIGEKTHKKFSKSAKIEKEYVHYFYSIDLSNEIEKFNEKEFEILNRKYKWFSFDELHKDERIKKVNSDILSYVKEFNI